MHSANSSKRGIVQDRNAAADDEEKVKEEEEEEEEEVVDRKLSPIAHMRASQTQKYFDFTVKPSISFSFHAVWVMVTIVWFVGVLM